MIKVNGEVVNLNHFPDGTLLMKYAPRCDYADIVWHFESNEELLGLMFLVCHLRQHGVEHMELHMPYIPNARQDRVKTKEDVFTLKHFAWVINSLGFDKVYVLDPHSSVSEALLNNLVVESPQKYIKLVTSKAFGIANEAGLTVFFPDEGAMKRYSGLVNHPYVFGIKQRDWATGRILGLDVAGQVDVVPGGDVLIIDDICSRGGTFYHSAKKLKELGANRVYLYVTHCEPTILEGELFSSGLIEKVFTTNSIFNETAYALAEKAGVTNKIEVFEL